MAQRRLGYGRRAELEADHLALLGDPERTVHRARRLRLDRLRRGPAAATNGAAAAVEQRQLDGVLGGHIGKRFLGSVLGPGRGELTGILRRVEYPIITCRPSSSAWI